MYIFTDESGHFFESTNSHWGIIVIVSITDKMLEQFEFYYQNLLGDSWRESKASKLDYPTREKLLKYIGRHDEIRYSAFVYDYAATTNDAISRHRTGQIKKLEDAIEKTKPVAKHKSLIDSMELFRNRFSKLSLTDYMKVVLITEGYRKWIQTFTCDYCYTHLSRDGWHVKHIFDTQPKPHNFVEIVYELLYLTTNSLAGDFPMYFPEELPRDHPILKNYDNSEGFDLKKFFSDRTCSSDQESVGLKIPDLISNTLFRSIERQQNTRWIKILRHIYNNRSFVHRIGRGGNPAYYSIVAFPDESHSNHPSENIRTHWEAMESITK